MSTLAHFYHIWADGQWQEPVAEHLHALDASGLAAALDVKAAGIVGTPENRASAAAMLPGWDICAEAATGFEEVTLRALHQFAGAHDGKVLYAHTKGSWHQVHGANAAWRRRLTACCAGRWREAAAALDAFDCAGPHWLSPERFGDRIATPVFAGNFWWANLAYLRSLPPLADSGRYAAHRWLGEAAAVRACDLLPGWPEEMTAAEARELARVPEPAGQGQQ